MKKILSVCFLCFVCTLGCFAYNNQKLYDSDDVVYKTVLRLCTSSGVLGPTPILPITNYELNQALNRVSVNKLSAELKNEYDKVYAILNNNANAFEYDFVFEVTPQVFIVTDYNKGERNDFFLPYKDELPSINLKNSFFFGENIAIEGNLPIQNSPIKNGTLLSSFDWLVNYRNNKWNFIGTNSTGMSAEVPFLARGVIGNEWINLVIGRTHHSFGSGIKSNMIIGDNFTYQELMKLAFTSKNFIYNISLTHFDTQKGLDTFDIASFGGKHQTRVVHRFDINIIDKIRLSLNLSTLYFADSAFDIRWFNPLMIAHNYYNYDESRVLKAGDEANNLFALEAEWVIIPNLKMSTQFALDQFQTAFEDAGAVPAAWGCLANIEWLIPSKEFNYKLWSEFVYASDYLYLNTKFDDEAKKKPNYNYDYILGYHTRDWQSSSVSYTGYQHGPGSISGAIGFDFNYPSHNLDVNTFLLYRQHGLKGIYSPDFSTASGLTEHVFQFQVDSKWQILTNLSVFGGLNLSYYKNYKNTAKETFIPQMYVGLTWKAFTF